MKENDELAEKTLNDVNGGLQKIIEDLRGGVYKSSGINKRVPGGNEDILSRNLEMDRIDSEDN